MEVIITRIKGYVEVLYPTIKVDLSIDDEYIEFMVEDAVDRVLSYTNRDQLVVPYEENIVDYKQPNAEDRDVDFWNSFRDYPIPPRLERAIAKAVVQACKTIKQQNTATEGSIKSVSDNGQSVIYSDKLQSFFNSSDDAEIFSGSVALLDRYRIGTVLNNENTY
jgi:hypothetical protein